MSSIKYTPDLAERFYRECCLGKSKKEIAAEFMIYADTFDEWSRDPDKPEFAEAYKLGKQAQEAYWEGLGRVNIENPRFKESLYKFITGTRFGWSEKSEITNKNADAPMSSSELDQLIQEKLKASGYIDTDVTSEQSRTSVPS